MLDRFLTKYLRRDAGYYPILTLTGPRQSGKTTLARTCFPDYAYVNLEEPDHRDFAHSDPRGFLKKYSGPVVIDEAQRVPELFSAINAEVDRDPTNGRFVMTGSYNFLFMHGVSQSLAGRSGILSLLPFSRAELERQSQAEPKGPASIFDNRMTGLELWKTIWKGFYPRIHDQDIPPDIWLSDYAQTYLERDVRSLVNVGDLSLFERFLALVAGRTGQLLNYSTLANDCGVSVDTSRRWISVLQTSFIVLLVPPHHSNYNKRVIRTPKLYFWDTGLACWLLRIREPGQLETHPLRGAVFENAIVAEVAKAYLHHRRPAPLYFWRDQTGHEVDLIIEEGTELYPVEIKSGQTATADMLAGLKWWCRLAGKPFQAATLVYGGSEAYEREGISIRPWFAV